MAEAPAGMRIAERPERTPVEYDPSIHRGDDEPIGNGAPPASEREVDTVVPDEDDDGGGLSDDEVLGGDAPANPEPEEVDDSLAGRVAAKADLSEVWKQHGIEGLPADPNELRSQWAQSQAAQQRAQELQNQLVWQAHNYQIAEQQRQANIQWQQQQAAQQQQKPIFALPEFDRAYLEMVTTDENGNLIAKPGADPSTPGKIQAYAKARELAMDQFLKDPTMLVPAIAAPIRQEYEQRLQQQAQNMTRWFSERMWERDNAHWAYEGGKYTPNAKRTPAGDVYNRYYVEAVQRGFPDPFAYAQRALDAELLPHVLEQQSQSAAQVTAAQARANKDKEFLKSNAAKQSNRSGGQGNGHRNTPRPTPKGPDNMPIFDRNRLLKKLRDLPDDEKANLRSLKKNSIT